MLIYEKPHFQAKVSYMEQPYRKDFDEIVKVYVKPKNEDVCATHDHCSNKGICLINENMKKKCVCNPGYDGDNCGIDTLADGDWY